jgi:hypothetical protein
MVGLGFVRSTAECSAELVHLRGLIRTFARSPAQGDGAGMSAGIS